MVAPPPAVRITLADAVESYLSSCAQRATAGGLRPRTVENYAADLAELVRILGDTVITDDITGADIDRAITTFGTQRDQRFTAHPDAAKARQRSTQARFRESTARFFRHADTHGWVQASPMQWSVVKPEPDELPTNRTSLSPLQALALLNHGAGPADPPDARPHERNWARDRYLLALLLILGPRVSEIAAANLDDISPHHGIDGQVEWRWRIVGKGGRVRTIPLSSWLMDRHRDYQATRPAPSRTLSAAAAADAAQALILTGNGTRITPRDIQRLLRRAPLRVAAAADTPGLQRAATPHALRHTAATVMLSAGWDVKVVAQMLGHKNISTLSRYLDELPGELAAAVAASPLVQPHR